jgi:hypothetical protein
MRTVILGAALLVILPACGPVQPSTRQAESSKPATVVAAHPAAQPIPPKAQIPAPPIQNDAPLIKPKAPTINPTKFRWVDPLWVYTAEVGDMGPVPRASQFETNAVGGTREYIISTINDETQVEIIEKTESTGGRTRTLFIVDNIDTSKMVTGRAIDFKGVYKVTRIAKLDGGKTALVLEAETEDERAKREGR